MQAARGAGRPAHVIDLFADGDTRLWARSVTRVRSSEQGLSAGGVMAALEALHRRHPIVDVVVGSGFEGQPDLLARISERHRLIGNPAEVVRAVKDPEVFFGRLVRLGIPHPEVRLRGQRGAEGWLVKRIGGDGGAHVRPYCTSQPCGPGEYLQARVYGRACSVLFLADGRAARVIGYNETWRTGADRSTPYRYAGAMRVATLPLPIQREVAAAVTEIVGAFHLRGLCGVDFMLGEDGAWKLLELNPRPTASFELHGPAGALWEAHLRACSGRLPARAFWASAHGAAAQRTLYAHRSMRVPEGVYWPRWIRDRPLPGTLLEAGEPICTVTASAPRPHLLRRLVEERAAALGRWLCGIGVTAAQGGGQNTQRYRRWI